MNFKTLLCGILLPMFTYAQNKDVPGYFIDAKGQTHQVAFRYGDFKDAAALQYKEGADTDYKSLVSQNITEYGIGDDYKVKKLKVTLDPEFGTISNAKKPVLQTQNIFLNVLVEGDANLYSYSNNGADEYFFDVKGAEPATTQLVFRHFRMDGVGPVKEDPAYRQQLDKDLKCDGIGSTDFAKLPYYKNSLIAIFKKYNDCKGGGSKIYGNKNGDKLKISFTLFASAYSSSYKVRSSRGTSDPVSKPSYGVGAEIALLLPARTSELFVRGEYEQFKGTTTAVITYTTHAFNTEIDNFTYDAGFINFYTGYRHNFKSNSKGHMYADASIAASIALDRVNYLQYYPEAPAASNTFSDEIDTHLSFFSNIGIGYAINEKWAVDLRYSTPRDMFQNSRSNYKGSYSSVGINVRYSVN